jgi:ArsR family transcriptional regulator
MKPISRPDAEEWAAWFRALADPTRLQVLNAIAASGPDLTIGELVARVDIGQSTVSHHVRLLAQTGFILHQRDGTTSRVSVNPDCLAALPDAARKVLGAASHIEERDGRGGE